MRSIPKEPSRKPFFIQAPTLNPNLLARFSLRPPGYSLDFITAGRSKQDCRSEDYHISVRQQYLRYMGILDEGKNGRNRSETVEPSKRLAISVHREADLGKLFCGPKTGPATSSTRRGEYSRDILTTSLKFKVLD